ncbi:YrhK family protein [Frigoribacterium sp. PhB116]|uniref:YrhK family protein n=1 Tax=Frigoribacterium sp. PhB116 TaxID=2485174 RepID=UPI00105F132B|nr:YrhK family protein [Frigoribacterium sp. PhB116]TDT66441.1 YrhK-like protein [Frigoribacterium sp. PhB116]
MAPNESSDDRTLSFSLGRDEIVIWHKYEVASIVNDIMVAVWFVVGSILFFSESTTTAGTWLFLLGSVQLMIRPLIRLARRVHLQRSGRGSPGDASGDF